MGGRGKIQKLKFPCIARLIFLLYKVSKKEKRSDFHLASHLIKINFYNEDQIKFHLRIFCILHLWYLNNRIFFYWGINNYIANRIRKKRRPFIFICIDVLYYFLNTHTEKSNNILRFSIEVSNLSKNDVKFLVLNLFSSYGPHGMAIIIE